MIIMERPKESRVSKHCKNSNPKSTVSRRDFLRLAGVGAAGLLIQSCQPQDSMISPVPESTSTISAQVAVGQAKTYDRDSIESKIREMIEGLGGLGDVVAGFDFIQPFFQTFLIASVHIQP